MAGKLQIRVVAQTYRPEDILADWPGLVRLAWRGELSVAGGPPRGVLELVQDLWDKLRFDAPEDMTEDERRGMRPGAQKALELKQALEAALADWKPAEAARLALELEEVLGGLESLAPKPPFVVSKPKK